jgi:hypothetical protein
MRLKWMKRWSIKVKNTVKNDQIGALAKVYPYRLGRGFARAYFT